MNKRRSRCGTSQTRRPNVSDPHLSQRRSFSSVGQALAGTLSAHTTVFSAHLIAQETSRSCLPFALPLRIWICLGATKSHHAPGTGGRTYDRSHGGCRRCGADAQWGGNGPPCSRKACREGMAGSADATGDGVSGAGGEFSARRKSLSFNVGVGKNDSPTRNAQVTPPKQVPRKNLFPFPCRTCWLSSGC